MRRKCQIGLAELESGLSKTLVIVYIWLIITAYDYTRFYICGWHGMEYYTHYTVTSHWCRIVGTAQVNLRFCSDLKATASRCTEWGRGKAGDSISASVAWYKPSVSIYSHQLSCHRHTLCTNHQLTHLHAPHERKKQVSRPTESSSDWDSPDVHLMFTWTPDHHLTFPWPSQDPYLTLIKRVLTSPEIHLTFTWYSPDHLTIIWPSPDPHQTLT